MKLNKELIMKQVTPGIFQIETHYLDIEGVASCYLMEDNGEAAIIETNTNFAVPYLEAAVKQRGLRPEDVKYVILSHIHLDHAGGAGLAMQQFPEATLVVHARGRKHMVNPEKLIEGVKAVYGEEKYNALYGEIRPIEKSRVHAVKGSDSLPLGKRALDFIDSPGHAKHHMFIHDSQSGSIFSGDAFGISYPLFTYENFRLAFPSTSPVQFDPETALETYEKITALNPARILLTHYGSLETISDAHRQLKQWIAYSVEVSEKRYAEGYREEELYKVLYKDLDSRFDEIIRSARGSGLSEKEREFLFLDTDLNAQGLAHYIKKVKEPADTGTR